MLIELSGHIDARVSIGGGIRHTIRLKKIAHTVDDSVYITQRLLECFHFEAVASKVPYIFQSACSLLSLACGTTSAHTKALDVWMLESDCLEKIVTDISRRSRHQDFT